MENGTKKTIIWENNSEPPKNYIWVKEDGIAYEYDKNSDTWVKSTLQSGNSGNEVINGIRLLKGNGWGVYLNVGTIFSKSINIYDDKVSDIHYIAIQDPYNDNYVILIPFLCEATSENSANILLLNLLNKDYGTIYDNDTYMEALFTIEIETETEDPYVEIGTSGLHDYDIFDMNPESNVDKIKEILSVYGTAIKDAFGRNPETIEKMIGEGQDNTQQEPEGS